MIAPEVNPQDAVKWKEIIPQQLDIISVTSKHSRRFVAVEVEAEDGTKVRAFGFPRCQRNPVPRPAGIGVASSSFDNDDEANVEAGATVLRFRFSGPLQPECVYDFDVTSGILLTPANRIPQSAG